MFETELQPWLADQGFSGWYFARQSGEVMGPPEGVALFYRRAAFRPLAQTTVRFSDCLKQIDLDRESMTGARS